MTPDTPELLPVDREAALDCANEACRNMDGVLDLDAMAQHFARHRIGSPRQWQCSVCESPANTREQAMACCSPREGETERLERVAEVLAGKLWAFDMDDSDDCCLWADMPERARDVYREAAKDAIAALTKAHGTL